MHKTIKEKIKEKEELIKTLTGNSNEKVNPRITELKKELYMLRRGIIK